MQPSKKSLFNFQSNEIDREYEIQIMKFYLTQKIEYEILWK